MTIQNNKETFLSDRIHKINDFNKQDAYNTKIPVPKYETPTRNSGMIFINTPESAALISSIKNAPSNANMNFRGSSDTFVNLNADTSDAAINAAYGSYKPPSQQGGVSNISSPGSSAIGSVTGTTPITNTPVSSSGGSNIVAGGGGVGTGSTSTSSNSSSGGGNGSTSTGNNSGSGGAGSTSTGSNSSSNSTSSNNGSSQTSSNTPSSGSSQPSSTTSDGGIFNIKITNTYGISDPSPNGIYTIAVNNNIYNKDLTFNNTLDIPYGPGTILNVTIQPKNTFTKVKHYEDIFPVKGKIDIVFDKNNVFTLSTSDTEMYLGDDEILTFTNFGSVNDNNKNIVGSILNDYMDKQHFVITLNTNKHVKKIVLLFTIPSSST